MAKKKVLPAENDQDFWKTFVDDPPGVETGSLEIEHSAFEVNEISVEEVKKATVAKDRVSQEKPRSKSIPAKTDCQPPEVKPETKSHEPVHVESAKNSDDTANTNGTAGMVSATDMAVSSEGVAADHDVHTDQDENECNTIKDDQDAPKESTYGKELPSDASHVKSRSSGKQKKASFEEYRKLFLETPRITDRKTVFISGDLRDKLDEISRKLGDRKMSVSGFVENLARHHLGIYENDLDVWKKL